MVVVCMVPFKCLKYFQNVIKMGDVIMGVWDLLGIKSWLSTPEKKCARSLYFPLLKSWINFEISS